MPSRELVDDSTLTIPTDSHDTVTEKTSHAGAITPEIDRSVEMDSTAMANNANWTPDAQTPPTLTSPIGCRTGHASRTEHRAQAATKINSMDTLTGDGRKRDNESRKS